MHIGHREEHVEQQCTSTEACVHSTEVAVLADKIAQLESRINGERMATLERAYTHNDAHDPLHRLPPEVATAILLHGNPPPRQYEDSNGNPIFYLDAGRALSMRPLQLAAVCRHWRDLAFAEPRFWSTIVMRRRTATWDLAQELVEQWVARAGALRLTLVIQWDAAGALLNNSVIALVRYACSLSPRWRSVAFQIPSVLLRFFHCHEVVTVDLEYLSLITFYDEGGDRFSLGNTMVQPSSVMLFGISTPPTSILWANVTDLNMRGVISDALLGILPALTRVRKISASFVPRETGSALPVVVPAPTIELPCLTDVDIEDIEIQDITTFFPHLNAPSLAALSITRPKSEFEPGFEDGAAFPLPDIRRLLMGSEVLYGIILSGIPILPNDLVALLETLPSLRLVSLTDHDDGGAHAMSDALLARLSSTVSVKDGTDTFLPQLIRLSYTGPRAFSWHAVAEFFETHNKCRGFHAELDDDSVAFNLRPFINLRLSIIPPSFPEDFVDREVLVRFMELPGSWVRVDLDKELLDASFAHHHMDVPDPLFAWPDFEDV